LLVIVLFFVASDKNVPESMKDVQVSCTSFVIVCHGY